MKVKNVIISMALGTMVIGANAQIKILTNGNVGIGTNNVCHSVVKLQINYGGNNIAIAPDFNGPCIGGSTDRLDFWHPISKWNKVKFKSSIVSSDSTLKTDIMPMEYATNILKQIKTYSYYFKDDCLDTRKREYGVLAQELEGVLPELIDTARGNLFVNYNAFFAFLIKGFNEQQTVIEQLRQEIEILQEIVFGQELDLTELYELSNKVNKMQEILNCFCRQGTGINPDCCEGGTIPPYYRDTTNNSNKIPQSPVLYQNTPNPFSSNTEISCNIPNQFTNAFIYIYNLQGVELMSFPVMQTGYSTVIVYASALPAGMYLYTLVVDGVIIDSKRMILTK